MFKLSFKDASFCNSHCNNRGTYFHETLLFISFWMTSSKVIWKKMEMQSDLLVAGV